MNLFFKKYKIVLIRIIGVILLSLGILVNYLDTPKELSSVEIAAANVARMEASIKVSSATTSPRGTSPFASELNKTRQKQLEILFYLSIAFGLGLLIYSFKKKE